MPDEHGGTETARDSGAVDDLVDPADHRPRRSHGGRNVLVGALAIVLLGAGVGIGLLIAPGSNTNPSAPSGVNAATASANTTLLFVIEADSGYASVDPGQKTATLTLDGVLSDVLQFTNRPVREATNISAASFFDNWTGNGFTAVPPNAALVAPNGPPGHHPTPVVLTDPSYDAQTGTLTLHLEALGGQSLGWLSALTAANAAANGRLAVFIDNVTTATGSGSGSGSGPGSGSVTPTTTLTESQLQQTLTTLQAQLQSDQTQVQVLKDDGGSVDLSTMFNLQYHMQIMSQYMEAVSNTLSAVHQEMMTIARATKGQ